MTDLDARSAKSAETRVSLARAALEAVAETFPAAFAATDTTVTAVDFDGLLVVIATGESAARLAQFTLTGMPDEEGNDVQIETVIPEQIKCQRQGGTVSELTFNEHGQKMQEIIEDKRRLAGSGPEGRDLALAATHLEDALTRYNSAAYRRLGTWKRADPDKP